MALERPRPRRSGAPPGATSKALPEAAAERLRAASVACAPPLPSPLPPLPPPLPPLLTSVASRLALEQPATRRKIAGASNSYPYEPVRREVRIIRVPPAIDDDSAAAHEPRRRLGRATDERRYGRSRRHRDDDAAAQRVVERRRRRDGRVVTCSGRDADGLQIPVMREGLDRAGQLFRTTGTGKTFGQAKLYPGARTRPIK